MKAFLSFIFICCSLSSQELVIRGSSTLYPLAKKIAPIFKRDTGITVKVLGGGSEYGIEHAVSGKGIGMISRKLSDEEMKKNLIAHLIAYDGIAIITNQKNSISNIEIKDLKNVIDNKIKNWGLIGGISGDIHIYGPGIKHGTYRSFLTHLGISNIPNSANFKGYFSHQKVIHKVQGDQYAIGWVPYAHVFQYITTNQISSIKILEIDGIVPSRETIMNEKYQFIRPLQFVTNDKPTENEQTFIKYIKKKKVLEMALELGMVPK